MWWWAHWTGCMRYLSPMRIWSPLALERRRVGFIAHKSRKPWACCSFSRLRTLGDLILLLQHSTLYSPKSLLFMKIFQQNQRKSSHVCAQAAQRSCKTLFIVFNCAIWIACRLHLEISHQFHMTCFYKIYFFTCIIIGLLVLYLEVNTLI